MALSPPHTPLQDPLAFLAGGGEMGERIRTFDWTGTPIGPVERWSPALRTMVGIMLANRFPMLLWWGPQYVQLYNDAYSPIPGTKHPARALGLPASQCWSEIWHVIGPLIDTPYRGGPATWMDDITLEINRHGFFEESHFTIAYSPVPDDTAPGGIGGVLATVNEITEKVIAERRVLALRDLGTEVIAAKTAEEVCCNAARAMAAHEKDIPFALLYLIDGERARLAGASGVAPGETLSPPLIDLAEDADQGWPLAEVRRSETPRVVRGLLGRFGQVPPGPWADPPPDALVLPIRSGKAGEPLGLLVAGVSARIPLDRFYESFFTLLASQIATAIANALAYEEERRRAEALAEIDRAKTLFFSNVSHEFRTPLMLMLGPLEDALANDGLPAAVAGQLEVSHRNSLRLLKLVNTLLDFSRIEAGRIQACYRPTDLAALTTELVSNFRSACQRAGLGLVLDCPPLAEPVFVDPDMWEKIVLNLVSNAFKFTLEGRIEVRLTAADGTARLTVFDTGVGIPALQLPHMFERFHRIEESRGRTHEGTGIGLALVQELVRLHGGDVRIESELERGSTFTVTVPLGTAHLDPRRIGAESTVASTAIRTSAFVEEALRWLPDAERNRGAVLPPGDPLRDPDDVPARRARILIVDDNADMRSYMSRLLEQRHDVETVADGLAALERVRARRPDLVISDVMMPWLDGFGLLRELRANPETAEIPVVLVSARAGEEARIQGMEVGADDYLVKPFSARELIARVRGHLELAESRRDTRDALARHAEALRDADRRKDEFLAILAHELRNPLAPVRNAAHYLKLRNFTDPGVQPSVEMIERQITLMTRLIDDLFDASRITRGILELRRERLVFQDVVESAVEACRAEADARRHALRVTVPQEPIPVFADRHRLVQALSNVIANGCKYTPDGGRIDVLVRAEAGSVQIQVRDNGAGIPPDRLSEIFQLFRQLDRSLERQGGLGIGLTLARHLVEQHGGRIEARSPGPGLGSTFVITLPVAAAIDAAAPAPAPAAGDVRVRPRRILVADDNRDAAVSLALLLETMGHTVRNAYDGQSALDVYTDFRPDVAFLDIGMPGINGYDLARRVRQELGDGSARLIALTGWGQEQDRARARDAGFDTHLVKPLSPEALAVLLGEIDGMPPSPTEDRGRRPGRPAPHTTHTRSISQS